MLSLLPFFPASLSGASIQNMHMQAPKRPQAPPDLSSLLQIQGLAYGPGSSADCMLLLLWLSRSRLNPPAALQFDSAEWSASREGQCKCRSSTPLAAAAGCAWWSRCAFPRCLPLSMPMMHCLSRELISGNTIRLKIYLAVYATSLASKSEEGLLSG